MEQNKKVAVLGAGTIGPGIATTYIIAGWDTALYSRTQATLDRARDVIESNLRLFVEEGLLEEDAAQAAAARVVFTTELAEAVRDAWFIAETIVEKPDAKVALYRELDNLLPPDTIIASNTSYLDIFKLMPESRLPHTVIAHWYTPAHILPLVEVVKGEKTLPQVLDAVVDFHNQCGKTAVRMEKFIPGYIVNRMQSAMAREVLYLIEEGYCTGQELDLAVKTSLMPRGLMLGLVQRLDFNGIDMLVNSLNNKAYVPAPELDRPELVYDMYNRGELGVKTGKGFFDYQGQSYADVLRNRDRLLLKSVALARYGIEHPLHSK